MKILALAVAFLATHALAADLRVEPEIQPAGLDAPQGKAVAAPRRVAAIRLEAGFVPPAAKAQAARTPGVPVQVGHGRPVAALDGAPAFARHLAWETRDDGTQVAALSVTSPAAAALRVGLAIEALPAGAVLRFSTPDGQETYAATASEIGESLTLTARTGVAQPLYWSPAVESDTMILQVEIPAGASPEAVRLSAPTLSHLVTNASRGFATKAAATCNIDAMCHQGAWSTESNAVARIVFTRGSSSFVCTGTLLADRDPATAIPYFLTANHCVGDQATASTVQTYWFYRSTACNTGTRGTFQSRTGGGTLLYASGGTDSALLRLVAAPPAGATFAGWNASAAGYGAAVTGIHHPAGDLQKISFGAVRSFFNCVPAGDGKFSCNGASSGTSSFVGVDWTSGLTEGGSSGSGLFLDNGRYLVGQLYGGGGSCTEPGTDIYGRFDVAYSAGLSPWLGGTPPPVVITPPAPSTPAIEPALNYSDLWWNPAESGWGLSLTQHGSALFGAWYAYDASGRPLWVVMPGGRWTTPTTFTADLFTTTGPDPTGTFNPALVVTTKVGTATLNFTSSGQGTLTYSVNGAAGSKAIARQAFGVAGAATQSHYGDLWWSPAESGWGLSITHQASTLFAVWYAYGADGRPVWYVLPGGSWVSGDTYTGTLYRTASAPSAFFGAGGFNPAAVSATAVGSMTLRFWAPGSAVMSYTVNGTSGSKSIMRQSF